MKVAIAIGHWKTAPGAVNQTTALSEYEFNVLVASGIKLLLPEVKIFYRVNNDLGRLIKAINEYSPEIAIELHCNAYEKKTASGSEVLYWHKNKKTKIIAELMSEQFALSLGIPCRGGKGIKDRERGWYFLKKIKCPALICEPFFISNDKDLMRALINFGRLVSAYIQGIKFSNKVLEEES